MWERIKMIVGIIGLGLIGGSFAKSIKAKTHNKIFAFDTDAQTLNDAKNFMDEILKAENISQCDLILLAVAPSKAVKCLKSYAENISRKSIVVDLCGVKRAVCEELSKIANEHGFIYVGGHPMAGREKSGFISSTEKLFENASMILTPENINAEISDILKKFFLDVGFSKITFSTPSEHDRIIAYTSQLPHIISSAYIKSPDALKRKGFSAGSFRDMSRVAGVDANLWTELFLFNRDFLIEQLETFTKNIAPYIDALKENDSAKLQALLQEAGSMKERAGE